MVSRAWATTRAICSSVASRATRAKEEESPAYLRWQNARALDTAWEASLEGVGAVSYQVALAPNGDEVPSDSAWFSCPTPGDRER